MMQDGTDGAQSKKSLRKFRMDKEEALKGQSTLLRYFRNDYKKPSIKPCEKAALKKKQLEDAQDTSSSKGAKDPFSEGSSDPLEKPWSTKESLKAFRYAPSMSFPGGSSGSLSKSSEGEDEMRESRIRVKADPDSSDTSTGYWSSVVHQSGDSRVQIKAEDDTEHSDSVSETGDQNVRNPLRIKIDPDSQESTEEERSPGFENRFEIKRDIYNGNASPTSNNNINTFNIAQSKTFRNPANLHTYRTSSKPLYVKPLGFEPVEVKDEKIDIEKTDDESGNSNMSGGLPVKSAASSTASSAMSVETICQDQDSQDSSPRILRIKRTNVVVSDDEDNESLKPPSKKQHVNGNCDSSDDDESAMPDEETIDKFIQMWLMVYPFVDQMEMLDVYKFYGWDAKATMETLGKINRENKKSKHELRKREEENAKKLMEAKRREEKRLKLAAEKEAKKQEELERKKYMAEKKEEEKKQNDLKKLKREKIKAQKEAWKATAAIRQEEDLEEDEDDYQLGGSKVYDSEVESDLEEEANENLIRDRDLVLQFFNDASIGELLAVGGCSKKKAEIIMQMRPFNNWDQLVYRFRTEKSVTTDLLNAAKSILHVRSSVQQLMKKCEKISKDMETIVSKLVSGEEDAGISHQPETLNSNMQLKGYQLIGLNWLVLMHDQNLNGVLADEMGLGKTVQAISFLTYIKEYEEPEELSLIIVPSSTLDNWARELELWSPSLKVLQYHGSQDERRGIRVSLMYDELEETPDVILTTYNMVTTSAEDRALFKKMRFHCVILDEAHMLKNMASQRYENLMKIKARRRILLTGTPLQNNLVELMSILIFVMPQLLYSKKDELKKVFSMFPKDADVNKGKFERERIEQAKRIMKPFFLRRLKCDVLKDLPTKVDKVVRAPMSQRQQQIYTRTVNRFSERAKQHEIDLEQLNLKNLTELEELERSGGSPTKKKDHDTSSNMVMTLRKIANHPLLVREYYTDSKLKEISKILKKTSHRESVLEYIIEDFSVMSDFEIHKTCRFYPAVANYCLPDEYILNSGKFKQLDMLLPQLKQEGSRVLIFSQFVIVLDILEQYVKIQGYRYLRFDGSTQVTERQELIDEFTEDESITLFLLSTRAGGLGINLTAANTVILHDIDFNPYNDKQAEDRCHRVGQTKPVTIIRLIGKDTIEEGMLQIAQDKLQLERDVTGLGDDQQKVGDVVSLLKAALGLARSVEEDEEKIESESRPENVAEVEPSSSDSDSDS